MHENAPENVTVDPIGDRLLIRKIEPKRKTDGGIWIPDTAQNPTMLAEVLAVGPGRLHDRPVAEVSQRVAEYGEARTTFEFRPPPVKKGDFILHGRFAGHEIEVNRTTFHLLREEEVLAIVRGEGLREWVESQDGNGAATDVPDDGVPEAEPAPV